MFENNRIISSYTERLWKTPLAIFILPFILICGWFSVVKATAKGDFWQCIPRTIPIPVVERLWKVPITFVVTPAFLIWFWINITWAAVRGWI